MELYSFLFCLALGTAFRLLYLAATALAKRIDLQPVTVLLDVSAAAIVGAAFTVYVILSGAVIAPYMGAAMLIGYAAAFAVTKNVAWK